MGLAGDFIFHMVSVPSEWLQINCFPSWCQATEWIACEWEWQFKREEKEQEIKVGYARMGAHNSMGDFLIVTHTRMFKNTAQGCMLCLPRLTWDALDKKYAGISVMKKDCLFSAEQYHLNHAFYTINVSAVALSRKNEEGHYIYIQMSFNLHRTESKFQSS